MWAYGKHKKNRESVLILNIFLGWTLIGWVIAAVWAAKVDDTLMVAANSTHTNNLGGMKKCPYCAEDIQDEAIVCKHCKRSLPAAKAKPPVHSVVLSNTQKPINWKRLSQVLGILILFILVFKFWYIVIPGLIIWYLWKKKRFSKKTNTIVTAALIIVFALTEGLIAHANRAPILTISQPQNNSSVQSPTISVEGKVNPAKSRVTINDNQVATDANGNFTYQANLPDEGNNAINIVAENGGKQTWNEVAVSRIFTDAEKAAKAKADADAQAKKQAEAAANARAAQDEAAANAKAAQDAAATAAAAEAVYAKTPAGQLCTKHTDWTADDCQKVVNNKIWIGMLYDMVTTERGNPDHVSTSNYGNGNQYQACWYNADPECVYFGTDNVITIYN